MIRLVSFDAFKTLFYPRHSIAAQYASVMSPFLGSMNEKLLDASFKTALSQLRIERPLYEKGTKLWWTEVIKRTALNAGANEHALDQSLSQIVSTLLHRFSSNLGYEAYPDVLPAIQQLRTRFDIRTVVASNSDDRVIKVLQSLRLSTLFDVAPVLSQNEGCEKPSPEFFRRVVQRVNEKLGSSIDIAECLHVGDEPELDFHGAREAGMHSLLLERDSKEPNAITNLGDVVRWIETHNFEK
ncbi:HAD-like protein [Mycena floridula]|nr:HAD-like protein [Mycena floridula]